MSDSSNSAANGAPLSTFARPPPPSSSPSSSLSISQTETEKERKHFKKVLHAFDLYLPYSLAANNARRRSFYALSRSHRLLLSSVGSPLPAPVLSQDVPGTNSPIVGGRGFKARLDEIDDRIRRNADVLSAIVNDTRSFLDEGQNGQTGKERKTAHDHFDADMSLDGLHQDQGEDIAMQSQAPAKASHVRHKTEQTNRRLDHDVDKVRSTIKQLVRDWSTEGATERQRAYQPILEALQDEFASVAPEQRGQVRVLVPGSGLGRLAFDIAWCGFSCQGNEFSFYMLLASHYVLNKTARVDEHVVYPYVHSSSCWRTAEDMLRPVKVPDVRPSDLPSHVDFSMVAGEFVEVYLKEQERGMWNAVATCYFIDTAHNFIRYLEVINHVLPLGGVWINVGPLLWHFEGSTQSVETGPSGLSIELTLDEVISLIELMGFTVEKQKTLPRQSYTGHLASMLQYEYLPEFWVARKTSDVSPSPVV